MKHSQPNAHPTSNKRQPSPKSPRFPHRRAIQTPMATCHHRHKKTSTNENTAAPSSRRSTCSSATEAGSRRSCQARSCACCGHVRADQAAAGVNHSSNGDEPNNQDRRPNVFLAHQSFPLTEKVRPPGISDVLAPLSNDLRTISHKRLQETSANVFLRIATGSKLASSQNYLFDRS